MPTPIPDWDLARRLVKFVGLKQVNGEDATVRATSRTLGVGRERIEKILSEKNISYHILEVSGGTNGEHLILLKEVPPGLMIDAGISRGDLARSYEEFISGSRTQRRIRQRRLSKKQRESLRIKQFWAGQKENE